MYVMQSKTKKKIIIFTGGGTAGHVTPNIALIKKMLAEGWIVNYIGSKNGIEKELITKLSVYSSIDSSSNAKNITYFAIASGKLRRYFSWLNFIDPFKIIYGILQSYFLCLKLKPKVIFSKGGFVAFPVVVAGWLNKIPVIIHESDLSPGLANKLSFPFADKICITFPETARYFKNKSKVLVTGSPIRSEFFYGDAATGRALCNFSADKKIILVYGGSLGAEKINVTVRELLPEILQNYQIVHVCGKGKIDHNYDHARYVPFAYQNEASSQRSRSLKCEGYRQFEYLNEEFPHVMAAADIVIARSGANSIYELLILRKPHILIPLSKSSSRGDQIENAKYCAALGYSRVIFEEELDANKLREEINYLDVNADVIIKKLASFDRKDSVGTICNLLAR